MRKAWRSERGALPLAMIVLTIIVTMSAAIARYVFFESGSDGSRKHLENIQLRYAAGSGAEHYIYFIRKQLNAKLKHLRLATEQTGDVVRWRVDDEVDYLKDNNPDLGKAQTIDNLCYLTESELSEASWKSTELARAITMGNRSFGYRLLTQAEAGGKNPVVQSNSGGQENAGNEEGDIRSGGTIQTIQGPSIVLAPTPNVRDSFQVRFQIVPTLNGTTPAQQPIKVAAGFSVMAVQEGIPYTVIKNVPPASVQEFQIRKLNLQLVQ